MKTKLNELILVYLFGLFINYKLQSYESPLNYRVYDNETLDAKDDQETKCIYLFAHGLGAKQNQSKLVSPLMKGKVVDFNFPDAKNDNDGYYKEQVNLGQDVDIDRLNLVYNIIVEQYPEASIVLVALSRGSVTAINFMAKYKPEKIKAVVLESPFDTYKSIIEHLLKRHYVSWVPGLKKAGCYIFEKIFPKFDPKGVLPKDQAKNFPKDVPVMFIHSKEDELIPIESSERLYYEAQGAGNKNTYLIKLSSGRHAHLLQESAEREDYINAVHAFYQQHDLPHDNERASKGLDLLKKNQPNL